MKLEKAPHDFLRFCRLWALICLIHLIVQSSLRAEATLDSRFQYYQEDDHRIRVNSVYSLFSIDLNDTTHVDGSQIYSAISGASPTGLPPLIPGGPLPLAHLKDERNAFTLGLTKQLADHSIRVGYAYSTESDYLSNAVSLQDTISLNQKNTDLVLSCAYTDDRVGANGTDLNAPKRTFDTLVGISQVLSPKDLLEINLSLSWSQGFLSDPYKRVLLNDFFVLADKRPSHRFEQLLFLQWTHHLPWNGASMETSYRFGHNDFGSFSHTAQIALYQKLFQDRIVISPSLRYYWQSAANFYATQFTGAPLYYSSDYRVSKEESYSLGVQVRWNVIRDRLAVDAGYQRYCTRGLDGVTLQAAYPKANSLSAGLHLEF